MKSFGKLVEQNYYESKKTATIIEKINEGDLVQSNKKSNKQILTVF